MSESRTPGNGLTRRRLLGGAALAAAIAAMPPNVRRVLAEPVAPQPIEHIVLLMQENRSFDHYFGTMPGVRGFSDPDAVRLPDGSPVFRQPDSANPDGYTLPFHLDTYQNSVQRIPSTSHAWSVQHEALNGGKMDRWLPAHRKADGENGPYVMGYYERADIPFHFALADAFTVCDAYHCSVLGPTWPNRMMWMTGTIDPEGKHGGPIIRNTAPPGGYTWTTYPERLDRAGVDWKIYNEIDDYGLNVMEQFRQYRQAPHDSGLYTRGIALSPIGQFENDARAGKLPTVSWIMPSAKTCEHPDYRPADGALFIADRINAVASNPDLWAKTVFLVTYDENDGLFDHVVPPLPPDGEPHEFVKGAPIGGGYRVPCIIVSPWTAGGWVATERFDHTSCLRLLEWFTGVREPNISDWRRHTFGDLTSALRLDQPPSTRPVQFPGVDQEVTRADATDQLPPPTVPASPQSEPTQEPGTKPHRP
ncbi:phospholipase [Nocardia terpenica]|uniref:alkaline phosphatase family protein n=1 Tax=Nocardia terpenica TaxID=455432 RepID=UPI0018956440|nr:alkaline phosphatase family protein [Nocardia terpenica]MBF6059791.1 phospholipase [Nocardia terpenica]MBF6102668.1 phospholipase [Nocardia terpenica]MBF6111141.1 phospholipase [Nocardia terpenica]MBF6117272.1 phospholipase [Nocardia terpenica]MBF6150887.1 phospholipase [Nocardia terpenica]